MRRVFLIARELPKPLYGRQFFEMLLPHFVGLHHTELLNYSESESQSSIAQVDTLPEGGARKLRDIIGDTYTESLALPSLQHGQDYVINQLGPVILNLKNSGVDSKFN